MEVEQEVQESDAIERCIASSESDYGPVLILQLGLAVSGAGCSG